MAFLEGTNLEPRPSWLEDFKLNSCLDRFLPILGTPLDGVALTSELWPFFAGLPLFWNNKKFFFWTSWDFGFPFFLNKLAMSREGCWDTFLVCWLGGFAAKKESSIWSRTLRMKGLRRTSETEGRVLGIICNI